MRQSRATSANARRQVNVVITSQQGLGCGGCVTLSEMSSARPLKPDDNSMLVMIVAFHGINCCKQPQTTRCVAANYRLALAEV